MCWGIIAGITYGYIWVSSKDQNEDRQLIAKRELSVPEKILVEFSEYPC